MDRYDDRKDEQMKLQAAVGKLHFLKTTSQLVVSVAFLSIFCCHYSSGFSLFPHSFNVYFSTFLFSFFTRTLQRKYMFLLCNGILAFLVKTSWSSANDAVASFQAGNYNATLVAEGDFQQQENTCGVEKQSEKSLERGVEGEEQDSESEVSVMVKPEACKEGENGCLKMQEDEELEEDDGAGAGADAPLSANEEAASTEELNRKFEEFIRKMKEEIRIEAQQQLITV